MKKLLFAAAALCAFGFIGTAQAADTKTPGPYDLPLVGEYVNDAGFLVIAPAAKGENANYNVGLQDKSGKCSIEIVAGTWQNSEQKSPISKPTHPKAIVAVQSQDYPNFSLWPEDEKIRLSDDALPLDKLDPACAVFKGNMVFTRK